MSKQTVLYDYSGLRIQNKGFWIEFGVLTKQPNFQ